MNVAERDNPSRRIWGLTARELHDCFWASRGVQVVRQRQHPLLPEARLYLLLDRDTLVLFPAERVFDTFRWPRADVVLTRIQCTDAEDYQELAITDDDGRLLRFERRYQPTTTQAIRIGVTRSRKLAGLWHAAHEARSVWRFLRNTGYWDDLATVSVDGGAIYDAACQHEQDQLLRTLVQAWADPDASIADVRRLAPGVWAHCDAEVDPQTRFIGPAWLGAGRATRGIASVLGPAVLWDERATAATLHRPPRPGDFAIAVSAATDGAACPATAAGPVRGAVASGGRGAETAATATTAAGSSGGRLLGAGLSAGRSSGAGSVYTLTKRGFDLVFGLAALLATLPLYPLVMLAIWLEDGRPFFFVHRRETRGGRGFGCIKFRTMRKDAELARRQLSAENQCDGPQFFIADDPRVTRVGAFLRKHHVDEWPQFWNVLRGEMSLVGPRPSPTAENQFCPEWREARLSVPAGVTGLWQVQRTRGAGRDFREWIEFDVQYVQRKGWRMDLYVLWRTIRILLLPRQARAGAGAVDRQADAAAPAAAPSPGLTHASARASSASPAAVPARALGPA